MAITIRHGVNSPVFEGLAGLSVGEIRRRAEEVLNLSGQEEARINNIPADDETTVPEGATVEFVKVAGEKGAVQAAR